MKSGLSENVQLDTFRMALTIQQHLFICCTILLSITTTDYTQALNPKLILDSIENLYIGKDVVQVWCSLVWVF